MRSPRTGLAISTSQTRDKQVGGALISTFPMAADGS
jgi:hypothetical protein